MSLLDKSDTQNIQKDLELLSLFDSMVKIKDRILEIYEKTLPPNIVDEYTDIRNDLIHYLEIESDNLSVDDRLLITDKIVDISKKRRECLNIKSAKKIFSELVSVIEEVENESYDTLKQSLTAENKKYKVRSEKSLDVLKQLNFKGNYISTKVAETLIQKSNENLNQYSTNTPYKSLANVENEKILAIKQKTKNELNSISKDIHITNIPKILEVSEVLNLSHKELLEIDKEMLEKTYGQGNKPMSNKEINKALKQLKISTNRRRKRKK